MPFISLMIYLAVLALWALLFGRAFFLNSIWAWSAGMVYIAYDTVLMLYVVWQTLPLAVSARGPSGAVAAQSRPSVGILIAAHNEALNLPEALAAIARQSDAPDLILIADDGSRDATDTLLRDRYGLAIPAVGQSSIGQFGSSRLQWLRLPHQGKARALNTAILKADTDIVITLDADTFLADDAIAEMRAAFAADPALVAAGGILVPVCDDSASGRVMQWFQTYEYIRNIISRFAWMRGNSLLLISGAFAGFRREALVAVGGFDPECLVEDYELTHRMHRYAVDHGLDWQLAHDRHVAGAHGSAVSRHDVPAAAPALVRGLPADAVLESRHDRQSRAMAGSACACCRSRRWIRCSRSHGLTAFVLLLALLVTGKTAIAVPVFGLITAKIVADFLVYLWTVHLYQRLTGGRTRTSFAAAVFAAILEPFSFQLLRHAGAAWGWIAFLRGNQ